MNPLGVVPLTDGSIPEGSHPVAPSTELPNGEVDEALLAAQEEDYLDAAGSWFYLPGLFGTGSGTDEDPSTAAWTTPVDIGSAVVKKMKDSAEAVLGYPVVDAVITVPAKFGRAEIQRTLEAYANAGLKVARIMDEPTAAAVAYGLDKSEKGRRLDRSAKLYVE